MHTTRKLHVRTALFIDADSIGLLEASQSVARTKN